jgi:hypothetical protein
MLSVTGQRCVVVLSAVAKRFSAATWASMVSSSFWACFSWPTAKPEAL